MVELSVQPQFYVFKKFINLRMASLKLNSKTFLKPFCYFYTIVVCNKIGLYWKSPLHSTSSKLLEVD